MKLSGRVVDPSGKPVAGAEIFVGVRFDTKWPEHGPATVQAVTATEGRFRFTIERKELEPDPRFAGPPPRTASSVRSRPDSARDGSGSRLKTPGASSRSRFAPTMFPSRDE